MVAGLEARNRPRIETNPSSYNPRKPSFGVRFDELLPFFGRSKVGTGGFGVKKWYHARYSLFRRNTSLKSVEGRVSSPLHDLASLVGFHGRRAFIRYQLKLRIGLDLTSFVSIENSSQRSFDRGPS